MRVPEAGLRMVEGTYEDTKSRVLCGPGVRRVQSKCRPDTGERIDPIVVGLCGGTDKQKDLYKRHSPETIVRIWPGSSSGWGSKSPRIVDRVERYFQHTWTEGTFGEDGGNVGGA